MLVIAGVNAGKNSPVGYYPIVANGLRAHSPALRNER